MSTNKQHTLSSNAALAGRGCVRELPSEHMFILITCWRYQPAKRHQARYPKARYPKRRRPTGFTPTPHLEVSTSAPPQFLRLLFLQVHHKKKKMSHHKKKKALPCTRWRSKRIAKLFFFQKDSVTFFTSLSCFNILSHPPPIQIYTKGPDRDA